MAGDGCYGERRRRWCLAVSEGARERREEPRASEREQGGGVASSRASRRGGEGRQARREVAWRGGRARAPATLPSLCRDEDDRGGRWAGPAAGWAGQLAGLHREEPQVSFSLLFISVF